MNGRHLVGIFDDEQILAAVIGRILTRIDDHRDAVAGIYADTVGGEITGDFLRCGRTEVLLFQNLIILEQIYCHTIRIGRVCILVQKLGIQQIDIDLAVFSDDPFHIGRFAVGSRYNVILLDFYTVTGEVFIFIAVVVFNIDREERIRMITELVIPAIVSLRAAEIVQCGSEIDTLAVICRGNISFRIADQAAEAVDGKLKLAAVVCVVVNTADDHRDEVALSYVQGRHIQSLGDLIIDVRCECLLRQHGIVVIQRDSGAVRPGRVGIFVQHLRIGCADGDCAVLRDFPLDDRGTVMRACVDIVTLDLQPAWLEVSVLCTIKRCDVSGIERIVAVAALEIPAVAALRTEVCQYIGNILPYVTVDYRL